MGLSSIKNIRARQLLDGNGRPVIEVDVVTDGGHLGRAGASTGTSVGANEAIVLRDGDPKLYGGMSVYKAIDNVEKIIAPALIGMDVLDQEAIDRVMIDLDGTRYKTSLGGNSIYATSIAVSRAAACVCSLPLCRSVAKNPPTHVFTPTSNVVNGGTVAGKTLAFQEFMIVPCGTKDANFAVRMIVEVFARLGQVIKKEMGQVHAGSYSGYGVPTDDPFGVMDMIVDAVSSLGYQNNICYALDCAASEFFDKDEAAYCYRGKWVSRDELIDELVRLADRYPLAFIEDALDENDFEGYAIASQKINSLIIGDDLLCTSVDRAKTAYEMGAVRGMVFKPNQAGTLTEALEAAEYMLSRDMLVVASGRAGGVTDAPEKELAIALGLAMAKNGAPLGTRTIGHNFMLRTAEELQLPMMDIGDLPCFAHLIKGRD